MYQQWVKEQSPERRAEMRAWAKAAIPLGGDHGLPADAASLNVFLASDMSSFITGQLICVDGGMIMGR
jgi:NAD(P)-dependent dehydrogenase (short-subunit alcohol dehydrogenase family)